MFGRKKQPDERAPRAVVQTVPAGLEASYAQFGYRGQTAAERGDFFFVHHIFSLIGFGQGTRGSPGQAPPR